jgi:hypothetical protein
VRHLDFIEFIAAKTNREQMRTHGLVSDYSQRIMMLVLGRDLWTSTNAKVQEFGEKKVVSVAHTVEKLPFYTRQG